MTRGTRRRKVVSSLFVAFCAVSVLLALVPLAFVLFFVVSQGIQSLNVAFFTHMPVPVGRDRRRDGQCDRRIADPRRPRSAVRRFRSAS